MNEHPLPDIFSTHSAARCCRVTPMTIIRWINEGRIRAYKTPGGHRRIMRADLEDFCRRSQIPLLWEVPSEGRPAERVLIVDDDPTSVDAILDALFDQTGDEEGTFEVRSVANLFDAGRMVVEFRPHVLFVDLELPGLDPAAMARAIHEDPALAGLRLVGVGAAGTDVFDSHVARPIAPKAVRRATGPLPKLG